MVVEFVKRNWVYGLDGWIRNLCAIGKGREMAVWGDVFILVCGILVLGWGLP